MQRITHILFSLLITLIIFGFNPKLLLIALLTSMIPDLDYHFEKLRKETPMLKVVFRKNVHRKILHNIWAMSVTSSIIFLFFQSTSILAVSLLGYASHLLLDSLTPRGVTLLWPIKKMRIKGRVKTGSIVEKLIAASLMIVIMFYLLILL